MLILYFVSLGYNEFRLMISQVFFHCSEVREGSVIKKFPKEKKKSLPHRSFTQRKQFDEILNVAGINHCDN